MPCYYIKKLSQLKNKFKTLCDCSNFFINLIIFVSLKKNCDYVIVSGARRKEERWEPSATETVELTGNQD